MSKKYTRSQIQKMYEAFSYLQSLPVEPSLSVVLLKNIRKLKPEVDAVTEASNQELKLPLWKPVWDKKIEIIQKYCLKNPDGSMQARGVHPIFPTPEASYQASLEVNQMQANYPEAMEEYKTFEQQLTGLLAEEVELELQPITLSKVKSPIVTENLEAIADLVD